MWRSTILTTLSVKHGARQSPAAVFPPARSFLSVVIGTTSRHDATAVIRRVAFLIKVQALAEERAGRGEKAGWICLSGIRTRLSANVCIHPAKTPLLRTPGRHATRTCDVFLFLFGVCFSFRDQHRKKKRLKELNLVLSRIVWVTFFISSESRWVRCWGFRGIWRALTTRLSGAL